MDEIGKLENNVSSFLNNIQKDAPLLAAVSGGADSMAMLASLCAVAPKEKIFCMHIEHGLRPAEESCGDADFVRDFCKTNGIKFCVKHIKPGRIAQTAKRKGIGIEAAARYFRHRALSKAAKRLEQRSADCSGAKTLILLAHTKDDLLETALMRVLRGAGPAGLAAMRSIAAMPQKRGRIIRPLLAITRADVIGYLKAKNITWREDSTNADIQFLRNKIRLMLVPLLNDAFPSWKSGLAALAETQSLAAEFISREADKNIKWTEEDFTQSRKGTKNTKKENKKERNAINLSADEGSFFAQPQIVREEAVFQAINSLVSPREVFCSAKSVRRAVVRRFCGGKINAADLGSVRLKRENGRIILSKKEKEYFKQGFSRLI